MKFKRIVSALLVLASALAVATSCKKEDPEPDLISFNISTSSTETTNELRADDGSVIMTAEELKSAFNFFSQSIQVIIQSRISLRSFHRLRQVQAQ